MGRLLPIRRLEGSKEELSDRALLTAAGQGEATAVGALFDRYHRDIYRFIRAMVKDDEVARDLLQCTFEKLPNLARRFRGQSTVKSWLFGIANNHVRHHHRALTRRLRFERRFLREAKLQPPSDSPAAQFEERERWRRTLSAVQALPPKLREAVLLVYVEGISGREAASALSIREGTLYKRLHIARIQLSERLKGEER